MPKKRHIVLVSPPTSSNRIPEENLGLEYLASESRQNGHTVRIIDSWMAALSVEETIAITLSEQPDIVGISPSMDSFESTKKIVFGLRRSGFKKKIILGGIYASFEAMNLVSDYKDAIEGVLTGEADYTFQEFINSLEIKKIPGAVYFESGEVVTVPRNTGVEVDIDTLPFPLRDNLALVKRLNTPSHVMGSRGCYGNCSFCSVACFQKFSSEKRWRGRSPQSIVKELSDLAFKGETMVKFIDDNFFGSVDKTREKQFIILLKQSGINIRFRLSLRVNDVEDELIRQLKEVGLFAVSLGVESFVQRKLNCFAKGTTVSQNIQALNILKKHQVYVQMGHIMFDPFMNVEELNQEIEYLEKNPWPVTKGICTKLFAAEGTEITWRIKEEIGVTGKEGTNYTYDFKDKQINSIYGALRLWAIANNTLYDMAIDPVSAPKNVAPEIHAKFHQLCQDLRKLDLLVVRRLIDNDVDFDGEKLKVIANSLLEEFDPELKLIKSKIDRLYFESGLRFNASGNKRI